MASTTNDAFSFDNPAICWSLWRCAVRCHEAYGPGMILLIVDQWGKPGVPAFSYVELDQLSDFRIPGVIVGWVRDFHDHAARKKQPVPALVCTVDRGHKWGGSIYVLDEDLSVTDICKEVIRHYGAFGCDIISLVNTCSIG